MIVNSAQSLTSVSQDQQTYVVLPSNLMRLFGEICGYHDLDDRIYEVLGEDATFRINELLSQSENLKRRLNKERLDGDDLNRMLKCYNVRSIEGHKSNDRLRSVLDDQETAIDLISESAELLKIKHHHVRLRSLKLNGEFVNLKYWPESYTGNNSIEQSDLLDDLKKYYNFLIQNLFQTNSNPNSHLFERFLKDLSSNQQLGDLVPYLISHLKHTLANNSFNEENLIRVILIVESLLKNRHLEFKLQPSLIDLIDLALDCLLINGFDDILLRFEYDFLLKFRSCSAKLLNSIICKFHYVINASEQKILIQILELLLKRFIDTSQLDIKYGIVIFFQHLNPFIFFDLLFDHLIQFMQQLDHKRQLTKDKLLSTNEEQFTGTILLVLASCFNYVIKSRKVLNSNEFDVGQYYSKIYEVYGDSFSNLIASNDFDFIKFKSTKTTSGV